ncbi:hypothetical protein MHBO_002357 [Bonamia ostreae]|uniref:Uncharacterized protein n=1 Tax=Bonamia ostreae TaxID=126728 RepID=A0ABV2AMN3_9EUKA
MEIKRLELKFLYNFKRPIEGLLLSFQKDIISLHFKRPTKSNFCSKEKILIQSFGISYERLNKKFEEKSNFLENIFEEEKNDAPNIEKRIIFTNIIKLVHTNSKTIN